MVIWSVALPGGQRSLYIYLILFLFGTAMKMQQGDIVLGPHVRIDTVVENDLSTSVRCDCLGVMAHNGMLQRGTARIGILLRDHRWGCIKDLTDTVCISRAGRIAQPDDID